MAPRRKVPITQTIFRPVGTTLNRFFSLLVPRDWSRATLERIINDDERCNDLIKIYIESELAKMNTTGVTGSPFYMAPEYPIKD